MMSARSRAGHTAYGEFQPRSEWNEGAAADVLTIHLSGFIKDQIKITYAVKPPRMMIRGERPLGNNVVSRFSKEFPIPENCKFNEMSAKFDQRGVLTVSMPKKAATLEIARPKAAAAAKGQKPQSGAPPRLEKAGTDRTAPPPKTQEENLSPPSRNTATSAVGKEPEMKTDEKVTDPTAGPKAPAITETKTQKGQADDQVSQPFHPLNNKSRLKSRKAPQVADDQKLKDVREETELVLVDQKVKHREKAVKDKDQSQGNEPTLQLFERIGKEVMDQLAATKRAVVRLQEVDQRLLVSAGVAVLVIVALGAYIGCSDGSQPRN